MTGNDNRYHNGKIYTIRSFQTDKYYIGSTCLQLHKRLYQHRQHKKRYDEGKHNYITSLDIIQYDDHYIELLEEFKCENKNELNKREGVLIRLHINDLVNKRIEGRTDKQYKIDNKDKISEDMKQYQQANKAKISEQRKQYNTDNKDKISEDMKQYNKANKDKISERKKQYNKANKAKISEQRKQYNEANKEKISARRKELYQLKKQNEISI